MTDYKEILRYYGVAFVEHGQHQHATRGWVNTDCPHCSPGSAHFRLGFCLAGKYFTCWSCGSQPLIPTLGKLLGLSSKAAVEVLEGIGAGEREIEAPRGKLVLPGNRRPLGLQHRAYLANRGFDPDEIVELWKIEGIAISWRIKWRIFIPAYFGDEIVSWTSRALSDQTRYKYISAQKHEEKFSLKEILYGEYYCNNSIIVNEGPLDAWAIGPGAVAVCGLSYTRAQLLRMSKYPLRVICFDNEPEAQRRAKRLCDNLAVFPGSTYNVILETGKDSSRANKYEVVELRKRFLDG